MIGRIRKPVRDQEAQKALRNGQIALRYIRDWAKTPPVVKVGEVLVLKMILARAHYSYNPGYCTAVAICALEDQEGRGRP